MRPFSVAALSFAEAQGAVLPHFHFVLSCFKLVLDTPESVHLQQFCRSGKSEGTWWQVERQVNPKPLRELYNPQLLSMLFSKINFSVKISPVPKTVLMSMVFTALGNHLDVYDPRCHWLWWQGNIYCSDIDDSRLIIETERQWRIDSSITSPIPREKKESRQEATEESS